MTDANYDNQEIKNAGNQVLQTSLPGAVRLAVNAGNGQFFPTAPLVGTETKLSQLRDPIGIKK